MSVPQSLPFFDSLAAEAEFYRWPWVFRHTHDRRTTAGWMRLGTIRDRDDSAVATNMHELAARLVIAVLADRYIACAIDEGGRDDASSIHTEATD
jgi:hypothetical protein